VIVILGIISAVAAPRFFDLQDYKEIAFKDELVSALRFAQKRAVASGCAVMVKMYNDSDGKARFALYRHKEQSLCKQAPDPDVLDDDEVKIVSRPSGGDFENDPRYAPKQTISKKIWFDALGRAKITSQKTEIDINNEGSGITIWRETGYVEVN
jgi:MSHA pilin protein MshC